MNNTVLRALAGIILVVLLVLALVSLTGGTAEATDSNQPEYWQDQPGEICVKVDDKGTESGGYTVPSPEPEGRDYSTLIIKKGSGEDQNTVIEKPVAGQTYYFNVDQKGYSHVILCTIPETPVVTEPPTPTETPTTNPPVPTETPTVTPPVPTETPTVTPPVPTETPTATPPVPTDKPETPNKPEAPKPETPEDVQVVECVDGVFVTTVNGEVIAESGSCDEDTSTVAETPAPAAEEGL